MLRQILASAILLPVSWLLFGAPRLDYLGNSAILAVFAVHLLAVIWNDVVFDFFGGDRFTYGSVAFGLNGMSVLTTFLTTWITLHWMGKHIEQVTDISPYSWGIMLLGLLTTFGLPILAHHRVRPLAKAVERRTYEDPTKDVG